MKNTPLWDQVKVLLAVLAVLNLIALFFFNYRQSRIPNAPSGYTSVYLTGGEEVSSEETGEEEPASEDALPKDYTGPSITLEKELPVIAQEDLNRLPQALHDLDLLSADDGTGKDISSAVSCTYSHTDGRDFAADFTVKNTYGDTATASAVITVNLTKPMVILKQDHISINKGDSFDPKAYIEEAFDTDGKDLTRYVVTSGTVNTKTSGTYEVEYSVSGQESKSLGTARLTVIVQ